MITRKHRNGIITQLPSLIVVRHLELYSCLDNVIQLAQQLRIPIQYITRIELDKYTEGRPHQVCAFAHSQRCCLFMSCLQ